MDYATQLMKKPIQGQNEIHTEREEIRKGLNISFTALYFDPMVFGKMFKESTLA